MKNAKKLLLTSSIIGSLWSCGSNANNTPDNPTNNNTATTTVTDAPKTPALSGFSMKATLGDMLYAGAMNPIHAN